ncbi:MAG TPA: hypothetical protein DEG43_13395 [Acidimicrobiaceae bacterium]|nr:hypothetical protein [Acidimicrobiaceae bacterium]
MPTAIGLLMYSRGLSTGSSNAVVEVEASQVLEVRSTIISRLTNVGAVRVGEETSYESRGTSTVTFNIPALRLEEALIEIQQSGGAITKQKIDLEALTSSAEGITTELDRLSGCLGSASTAIDDANATTISQTLTTCQNQLAKVDESMQQAPGQGENAQLTVKIRPPGSNNLVIWLALAVLIGLLVGIVLLIRRAGIAVRQVVDITDDPSDRERDLFLGRN